MGVCEAFPQTRMPAQPVDGLSLAQRADHAARSSPRRTEPTTIDTDRGPKLDFYKSLPTIRHIALVYQDQMRIEHYRRAEQGFELEVLKRPEDKLHFEAVEFRLALDRVYFDVVV